MPSAVCRRPSAVGRRPSAAAAAVAAASARLLRDASVDARRPAPDVPEPVRRARGRPAPVNRQLPPARSNLLSISVRKKERKQTTQGRDGRTARRHHTGILRRGVWCASRRPPLGVRLFLSLFAASRRFSLQPSCHLAVAPFSSWSPLSLLPLSRRSPLPRPATAPPPAAPLLSLLGAALPSLLHILAPRVYRALLEQGRVF